MTVLRVLISLCPISGSTRAEMKVINIKPGKHATPLQDAINSLTKDDPVYHVIRLAPGTYREKIYIPKNTPPFKLLGESADSTRIVWNDNAGTHDSNGNAIGTFQSSSTIIESDDFTAEKLTFENDHGPGIQAVALSIGGDRGVFRNCRFLGWQDTLLLRKSRHFLDRCHIAGSVDFIFGDAIYPRKSSLRAGTIGETQRRKKPPATVNGVVQAQEPDPKRGSNGANNFPTRKRAALPEHGGFYRNGIQTQPSLQSESPVSRPEISPPLAALPRTLC